MNSKYALAVGGNATKNDREFNDYYATPPRAIDDLLSKISLHNNILEPATGGGYLAQRLKDKGYHVITNDLIQRNYPLDSQSDFLKWDKLPFDSNNLDIVTNPPYKIATDFVLKSLNLVDKNSYVCMFLKLQFLEGNKRRQLLYTNNQLKQVLVYSKRISTAKGGNFEKYHTTAFAHAWFVWQKGYKGKPTIDWI